jgi:hypothetical protein
MRRRECQSTSHHRRRDSRHRHADPNDHIYRNRNSHPVIDRDSDQHGHAVPLRPDTGAHNADAYPHTNGHWKRRPDQHANLHRYSVAQRNREPDQHACPNFDAHAERDPDPNGH